MTPDEVPNALTAEYAPYPDLSVAEDLWPSRQERGRWAERQARWMDDGNEIGEAA